MDLSQNGCRLRLGESLPRGAELTVFLEHAPKELSVEVKGSVIWSRLEGLSYQVGIHFGADDVGLESILSAIG